METEAQYEHSYVRNERVQVCCLYPDGFLLLMEDPELWILGNSTDRMSVSSLELRFDSDTKLGQIGDSIGELSELNQLYIHLGAFKCLPNSISSLHNLQRLELRHCFSLQELPANLGDLQNLAYLSLDECVNIMSLPASVAKLSKLTTLRLHDCHMIKQLPANLGDLESLTHLSLSYCHNLKSLPDSLALLSKLTTLSLDNCGQLQNLPANLGELESLTSLSLSYCGSINSLPNSITRLSKLTTVHLIHCNSLKELPANLKVVDLSLQGCCSIQSLPRGLCKLDQLYLPLCMCSEERLVNLKDLTTIGHLTIGYCSLQLHHYKELPLNLEMLPNLSVLEIQGNTIKWLPWSITKLSKLRFLILPWNFRLETLPCHLNDSIIISVEDTHVRRMWKELKPEIEPLAIPIVGEALVEAALIPSTCGYVELRGDPRLWIQSNYDIHSSVRILDLELGCELAENIINSIGELPELTHLYISHGFLRHLPLTFTSITHLSLFACELECDIESCFDSLGKLHSLESLHLISDHTKLPAHLDLPVSLRHLSLLSREFENLPDSYITSMRKLIKLRTLDLFGYKDLELLPANLDLAKLKIRNCSIKSLPRGLRHLEIIHSIEWCEENSCDDLQVCVNELENLDALSLTCYNFDFHLPCMPKLHNLQELQLKDCFSLEKLPPNLDGLVNLCTLNVSGTRIKSLPDSIMKLQKLQHIIVPKCFIRESLPHNLGIRVMVSIDNTDDKYYKDKGYCYSINEISNGSVTTEGVNEVLKGPRHKVITKQASPKRPLIHLPNATHCREGPHITGRTYTIGNNSHHALSSSLNHEMEILPSGNGNRTVQFAGNSILDVNETDGHLFPRNTRQVHAPKELEDSPFNGRIDTVRKNNFHPFCSTQNQEKETLPSRNKVVPFVDGFAAVLSSNLHEFNVLGKSTQPAFQNGLIDVINLETELSIASNDSMNSIHDETNRHALRKVRDKRPQDDIVYNKRQKIEITQENILPLLSQNISLADAATQLGAPKSTLNRNLKEYGIPWSSSSKKKQRQDWNMKQDTKSPSGGLLMDPTNPVGLGDVVEPLNGPKQHSLSDQVLPESNVVEKSKPDAMVNILKEPPVLTQCYMHGDQHVEEHSNRAKECTLLNTAQQPNRSSSTFVVKATYKDDTVRFDFSLSSSIEQLKKEVGRRLELEVGKFILKYQDGKELIQKNYCSDLEHALRLSKLSNSNVVRLLVSTET